MTLSASASTNLSSNSVIQTWIGNEGSQQGQVFGNGQQNNWKAAIDDARPKHRELQQYSRHGDGQASSSGHNQSRYGSKPSSSWNIGYLYVFWPKGPEVDRGEQNTTLAETNTKEIMDIGMMEKKFIDFDLVHEKPVEEDIEERRIIVTIVL